MPKKEKRNVQFVLNGLENKIQASTIKKAKNNINKEGLETISDSLKRSTQIVSNKEFMKALYHFSFAAIETCKLSFKETGDVSPTLMINMLAIMLAKMEYDKLIKINV